MHLQALSQLDEDIIKILDEAFGQTSRPMRFTVADGDIACMEHDKLFHSHSPDSLPIEPFLVEYSPLNELLVDGLKYYIVTFAKFSLATPVSQGAWTGEYFIYKLGDAEFRNKCNDLQKLAVVSYLEHLKVSRKLFIEEYSSMEYFERILLMWKNDCIKLG